MLIWLPANISGFLRRPQKFEEITHLAQWEIHMGQPQNKWHFFTYVFSKFGVFIINHSMAKG